MIRASISLSLIIQRKNFLKAELGNKNLKYLNEITKNGYNGYNPLRLKLPIAAAAFKLCADTPKLLLLTNSYL